MCYTDVMKMKINKKCPRCQFKMHASLKVCPNCSLNYEKFYTATNKDARDAIKSGKKDQVLMRSGFPQDVNKIPFLLLTIFLGFLGVHHYRVGRWKMGLTYSIFFMIACVNGVISLFFKNQIPISIYDLFAFLVLGWGLVLILWILDIIKVIFNKYSVPVSRKG